MATGGSIPPDNDIGNQPSKKEKLYDRTYIPATKLDDKADDSPKAASSSSTTQTESTDDASSDLPPTGAEDAENFDLGDLPERLSDSAGLGSIPELTLLLEDDEVIDKFEDENTAAILREISMDPSRLDELKVEPEIRWLLNKIEEKRRLIQRDPKYAQYRK